MPEGDNVLNLPPSLPIRHETEYVADMDDLAEKLNKQSHPNEDRSELSAYMPLSPTEGFLQNFPHKKKHPFFIKKVLIQRELLQEQQQASATFKKLLLKKEQRILKQWEEVQQNKNFLEKTKHAWLEEVHRDIKWYKPHGVQVKIPKRYPQTLQAIQAYHDEQLEKAFKERFLFEFLNLTSEDDELYRDFLSLNAEFLVEELKDFLKELRKQDALQWEIKSLEEFQLAFKLQLMNLCFPYKNDEYPVFPRMSLYESPELNTSPEEASWYMRLWLWIKYVVCCCLPTLSVANKENNVAEHSSITSGSFSYGDSSSRTTIFSQRPLVVSPEAKYPPVFQHHGERHLVQQQDEPVFANQLK